MFSTFLKCSHMSGETCENFPERSKYELSVRASQIQSDRFNNLKDLNKHPFNKKNLKKSTVKNE